MPDKFAAIRKAIDSVSKAHTELLLALEEDLPEDLRYELMRLAGSVNDYIFWVHRKAQPEDVSDDWTAQMYRADEIESGHGTWGVTAREAIDNYFSGEDLLDQPPQD